MIAERVEICPPGSIDAILADADVLGRMLRTLIAKLNPKP